EIAHHLLARGVLWAGALAGQPAGIIGQVAPIGLDGILGGAALGAHHLEKGVDQIGAAHSTPGGATVTTEPSSAGAGAGSGSPVPGVGAGSAAAGAAGWAAGAV